MAYKQFGVREHLKSFFCCCFVVVSFFLSDPLGFGQCCDIVTNWRCLSGNQKGLGTNVALFYPTRVSAMTLYWGSE